ncbi:MAG: hypothetical protein WAK26_10680 [Terracidiphilus sp.]
MPFPEMALLALMVFGALGILLTAAVILQYSMPRRAAKRNAAHPNTNHVTSGAGNPFHLKPR